VKSDAITVKTVFQVWGR